MIKVLYTCKLCGVVDAPVEVPARETAEHDLKEWVMKVGVLCGEDHKRTHPDCPTDRVDLKIPYDKRGEFLGQQLE